MHHGTIQDPSRENTINFPANSNGASYNLMKYDNMKPLYVQIRHVYA